MSPADVNGPIDPATLNPAHIVLGTTSKSARNRRKLIIPASFFSVVFIRLFIGIMVSLTLNKQWIPRLMAHRYYNKGFKVMNQK
jgi:hypothetical protein